MVLLVCELCPVGMQDINLGVTTALQVPRMLGALLGVMDARMLGTSLRIVGAHKLHLLFSLIGSQEARVLVEGTPRCPETLSSLQSLGLHGLSLN